MLEGVLVLAPLIIITIAILEFAIAMVVEQAIVSAASEGARAAARESATTTTIAQSVDKILEVHDVTFDPTGTNVTDDIRVSIEDGSGSLGIAGNRGNTTLTCTPAGGALAANEVRVTVCVTMTNASDQPVPNWLDMFGFSTSGRQFEVSAIALIE
ncbi:MAG: TadE/TadG family type IV pilus assembly protein [Planctomycetota bacterium]